MKVIKLEKKKLIPFLQFISQERELWAPVKKNDRIIYDLIEDFTCIDMNTTRTLLPPKKVIIPQQFNMFRVTGLGYESDYSHAVKKILFGIHPCDIHGLLILDKLFMQDHPDPYYIEARRNTLILGLSCWPDEHCFARSTNTHIIREGFDLFFTDLEHSYLVWVGSSAGDDLIKLKPEFFEQKPTDQDIQDFTYMQIERDTSYKTKINFISMPDLMELKYNETFWEKMGRACLGCGSCSMVCPTCNCYNVIDRHLISEETGERRRYWDSCTLCEYSEVAEGVNFRKNCADRLRLWYTHKMQAFISKYGKASCVGCGRCLLTCPVDINVLTVSKSLQGKDVYAYWNRLPREASDDKSSK
ncbi:MAG: hypothetical protein A2Y62_20250 [Candidatus Fischerbacteria bacterium RBG_13_37_8]|uniref:4Fe-4S ferredoxin-type domain-containing protein n=1 Tax=Candidatus Fischerbacteria bacterium RBG_13_37_8 TaxID=1817863 RepID=A0A1F5VFG6_9BACT|nr:MAG: hypothetical protein A2Y62_20250 [Candidatus Fischerbacteria bacterium RBG_13_37_8]